MSRKQKPLEPMVIEDEHGEVLAEYSPELLATIKNTVAKGATNEELYMFLQIASMYDLNPFLKEIWFTKMKDEVAIMTSRDGYAKIAKRDPNFKKCQSMAVFENDVFKTKLEMGEVVGITHEFGQNDRGKLVGAYAILITYNDEKLYSYVDYKEYDKRNYIWKNYPTAMLRKVAENDVYKRFANINGISTVEDMPSRYSDFAVEEKIIETNKINGDELE
jgi:phage recombination protein Bet